MKKLIKLDFNNTTRERKTEDSLSELYSYDKNNGSFEFEVLNDTLTTEQVTALFKFTDSNKIWKTTGTIEGNKINVTFDTSLITQNETVICYLYFDEEQRTSDTFRFKFKVKVSEIDKMNRYEVKERFINNTVIVDRLDVVTKEELKEALKNIGVQSTSEAVTSTTSSEIRGTGMPNGVVEAPIGATYIDTAKTNGALKWIKTTDGGNTGWKVVEGDTGWITIFTKDISIDSKLSLKIRRINNMVNVLFDGESYGEPFIKIFHDNNFANKKLMANGRITDGFKPASLISVPAHAEKSNNEGFRDAGAFLFDIQNNIFEINLFISLTSYNGITDGLANINFNYITYEPWPTELPRLN